MTRAMIALPGGYTNELQRIDEPGTLPTVNKRYRGPDARARRDREVSWLQRVRAALPVPLVVSMAGTDDPAVTMSLAAGIHGQRLIDEGRADQVLRACGLVLRRLHDLPLDLIEQRASWPQPARGQCLVHGDFGPHNVLLGPVGSPVLAVLDWEWAHVGSPVEDLAWCEWIVRMHHPAAVPSVDGFYGAYGDRPAWPERQAEMEKSCHRQIQLSHQWGRPDLAELWSRRLLQASRWNE